MLLTDATKYKAEHQDLFMLDDPIKINVATTPDSNKAVIPSPPITPAQLLALNAFPEYGPQDIATWYNMDMAKSKLETLVKLLAGLVVANSGITAIAKFYDNIITCFESWHSQ